jgi:hypothetical protein
MKGLRYLGWALLIGAFAAAAAEVVVSPRPRSLTIFVSAYDLWYTGWPGSLIFTQIRVERVASILWDPVLVSLLMFPGWLLLGVPGAVFAWFWRPKGTAMIDDDAAQRQHQEVMALYEDLVIEEQRRIKNHDSEDAPLDHFSYGVIDEVKSQFGEGDDELFSVARAEVMRDSIMVRNDVDEGEDESDLPSAFPDPNKDPLGRE